MVGIIAVVLCCMFLAVSCAKSSFQSPFHKTKTAQEMAERPTLELHTGAFQSGFWVEDTAAEVEPQFTTKFVVALKLRNVQQMHDDLMEISHPRSKRYGQYMNLQELQERFGPTKDERERVANFFSSMPGAQVKLADLGDMLEVTATVASIEQHLDTKLSWHQHEMMQIEKRSLRANKEIKIPQDVAEAISFVSLNSPINHMFPRASKLLKEEQEKIFNLDFSRPKEGAFLGQQALDC